MSKRLSIPLAAALLVLPLSLSAQTANIAGTWTTQTEVQGIAVNETCTFAQTAEGQLSGVCETSTGKYNLTGKVTGSSLTFTHPAGYQGEDMVVSFFGKVDAPTSISGTIDIQPINAGGAFAMTKQSK